MKGIRIFIGIVVVVAIIAGILALSLPRDQIVRLIMFRDFFDISLPILAFGALIKYLVSCPHGKTCCCCCSNGCKCNQKIS